MMMTTKQTQRVIFRKWRGSGDVIAFFPDQVDGPCIGSYEHVGQHGNATYPHSGTVPAQPFEYADLLRELEAIGYDDLRVVKATLTPTTTKRKDGDDEGPGYSL